MGTWLFFVLEGEVAVVILSMLLAVIPGTVLAGLLYCRGNVRAFFVGCVPPMVILTCGFIFEGPPRMFGRGGDEAKVFLLVCVAVVLASGAASAAIRYFATRRLPATDN
ncbi:MAG: hypothetical protein WD872_21535 [Pirellulaceae bacterium]